MVKLSQRIINVARIIINWWFLRLNSWLDCVATSRDIARHSSNPYVWFTRRMPGSLDSKITVLSLELYVQPSIIIYTEQFEIAAIWWVWYQNLTFSIEIQNADNRNFWLLLIKGLDHYSSWHGMARTHTNALICVIEYESGALCKNRMVIITVWLINKSYSFRAWFSKELQFTAIAARVYCKNSRSILPLLWERIMLPPLTLARSVVKLSIVRSS